MRALVLIAALALASCELQPSSSATAPNAVMQALTPANLPAFFDCLREQGHTILAAHRGGPEPGFAENAIPTFENTLRHAPALLEIDIAQTSDGVLVLMHDDTVDRTTTGEGAVSDLTLAQFQALSLQDNDGQTLDAHPPTLREALDWADGRTILELDVKRGVSYEDVIAEVRSANAADRIVFITYSVGAARRVHRLAPDFMISTEVTNDAELEELEDAGIDLTRILAWTGIEEPNSELNIALAHRGVEAMFGTLGGRDSWDDRFAAAGHDQYAQFAETGLQLISTDRIEAAARDIDANDGADGFAALQCASAR